MKILLVIVGAFLTVITLIPFSRRSEWWIRIFDFPRLQIFVVLVATLAAFLIFIWKFKLAENLFVVALLMCLVYQGSMMFPYTPFAAKQVHESQKAQGDSTFSILFANVLMENRNSSKLLEIIRQNDPDVILTVETNKWWQDELVSLEKTHPYTVFQPQDDTYGMLLYSRLELVNAEVKFLVEDIVPSIHGRVKLKSGTEVEIRCLHPPPPFPTEDDSSTERDAELLIVGKEIKKLDRPSVVIGDLNDVAWSHTNFLFQDISGLLDPRIGRGFYNTFHADYPFMRMPLDHCFHTSHFRLVDFKRLDYFGSDHFPVYIKLSFEPADKEQQELPEAEPDQKKEAEETIDKKQAEPGSTL